MFTLRSSRGRRALLAVVVLACTMIACDTDSPTEPAPTPPVEEPDEPAGDPDPPDEDAPEDEAEQEEAAPAPTVVGVSIVTCHDRNDAGGASDVVATIDLEDVVGDETVVVTYTGPAGEAMVETSASASTVLLPATNFDQVFTITGITVAGEAVDLAGVGGLSHTVPDGSGSDCSTHTST